MRKWNRSMRIDMGGERVLYKNNPPSIALRGLQRRRKSSQYGAITLDNDEFNVTISMTHDKERDLRQASMGYLTAAYMKGQLRCKKRSSYNVETIFVDPGGAVKINATCKNLFGSANELEIILLEEEVMTMYSLRF